LATGGWTPWEKIAFISDFSSWALASTKPSYACSELTSHPTTLSGYGITDAMSSGTTFWGQTVSNGVVNGRMTFTTLAMATNYTDVWNDGTNDHPWYGYDHRYQNTGVYSTTISDFFGLTFRTGEGWLSMTRDGSVGIGTTTPSVKLDVNGAVKATRFYLYKPNSDDTGAVYFQLDANGDVQLVGAGLWTNSFISALGQGSGGGGGGASALTDLTDVEFSGTPSNGQVLKYNGTTHKWYNGNDEGLTSLPWSSITGKPTTLGGYGITDAYISSGTIYLGGNSITPLTSFTETDPTVPAWAKASTKPSYSFSELTGTVAFSQLPTMYWADVAVSSSSDNNTSPQFGNLRLRPGSSNYGSYLRFGDGDLAYLAELSDDHLTYRAGSHTFNVSSNEAVQINSSGLRIGGSSGVVLSWDSTNNALKVQKADGTAANLYATGGVSALGMSGGSGGSISNLRVTGTLNIGSSYASLYCSNNNYLHVDAPRIYFDSTLYMGSQNIRTESGDIYTEEGNIYLGGGRLYFDSSRYIYLDGTTLKFYDGSTAKTIYTY
jgi:hypothetical protein